MTNNYNGRERPAFTPDMIQTLNDDEVFVFGSNREGAHAGGAARVARVKFGAIMGKGVGIQGQSYAIPTMHGGVDAIKPYVDDFIEYARTHPEQFFYVTRIGCGIAGFRDEDIAPLFKNALDVENICLPESFFRIIAINVPKELKTMMYGQVRTMIDLLKALNIEKPIKDIEDGLTRLKVILNIGLGGDEIAFMVLRTIWHRTCNHSKDDFDIYRLEEEVLNFHGDKRSLDYSIDTVLYHYSVAKFMKYIQYVNEFKRFKSYDEIDNILLSIPFSHCSENDPNYYFSFNRFTFQEIAYIISYEWKNITKDGVMDNELLEEVIMGRFNTMVKTHGLRNTIKKAYKNAGCHTDIKIPIITDKTIWGPRFDLHRDNTYSKSCIGYEHFYRSNDLFELRFAVDLLKKDSNYKYNESEEVFFPVSDDSLPIYSVRFGKIKFSTPKEKIIYLNSLRGL